MASLKNQENEFLNRQRLGMGSEVPVIHKQQLSSVSVGLMGGGGWRGWGGCGGVVGGWFAVNSMVRK